MWKDFIREKDYTAASQIKHYNVLQRSEWLSMEAAMLLVASVAC